MRSLLTSNVGSSHLCDVSDLLATARAGKWAVRSGPQPRLTYLFVLGMNDKRHPEDQSPKGPFPILDHLSWPT